MNSDRVLIRATSQRAGGGVQVAASFLDEVARLRRGDHNYSWLSRTDFWISSAVHDSLAAETVHELQPRVADHRPWQRVSSDQHYRVSFAVFGPEYRPHPLAGFHLAGYADVRSVYGVPRGEELSRSQALRWRFRGAISRSSIRRADELVVESASFRRTLQDRWGISAPIHLVPNVVNRVVYTPDSWEPVKLPMREAGVAVLSYVTRAYSHKNLEFLPRLHAAALSRGRQLRFWVSLSDDEWARLSPEFRAACDNVGVLRSAQVPTVLAAADGAIFPSLLESFSVSPLESFAMQRPCFASDRTFVRDSCDDAPCYIDPLDPESSADRILHVLDDPDEIKRMVTRGRQVLQRLPSASDRAIAYLGLIQTAWAGASHPLAPPRTTSRPRLARLFPVSGP